MVGKSTIMCPWPTSKDSSTCAPERSIGLTLRLKLPTALGRSSLRRMWVTILTTIPMNGSWRPEVIRMVHLISIVSTITIGPAPLILPSITWQVIGISIKRWSLPSSPFVKLLAFPVKTCITRYFKTAMQGLWHGLLPTRGYPQRKRCLRPC